MEDVILEDMLDTSDNIEDSLNDVDVLIESKGGKKGKRGSSLAKDSAKMFGAGAVFGVGNALSQRGSSKGIDKMMKDDDLNGKNSTYESYSQDDIVEERAKGGISRIINGGFRRAVNAGFSKKGAALFTGGAAYAAGELGGEYGTNYALDRIGESQELDNFMLNGVSTEDLLETAGRSEYDGRAGNSMKENSNPSKKNSEEISKEDFSPLISQAEENFIAACALADLTTVDERADLTTSLEDMQDIGEMMGIAMERTIVRLDRKARFNHLIKANNLTLARKDNHPKYRKLLTLWKMERAIETDLDRIYRTKSTQMAREQIKNYAANGIKKIPKQNPATIVGKKKVASKVAQRAKASADRFFTKGRTIIR